MLLDSLLVSLLLVLSGSRDVQTSSSTLPSDDSPDAIQNQLEENPADPTVLPLTLNSTISQTQLTEATTNSLVPNITSSPTSTSNSTTPLADRSQCFRGRSSLRRPIHPDYPLLKWVTWSGTLPRYALRIENEANQRSDYICAPRTGCYWASGVYTPSRGSYCYSPCHGREQKSSRFDLLVNLENSVILEWRNSSKDWSPPNPVQVWPMNAVGRSQHGLGTVYLPTLKFFVPWKGREAVLSKGFQFLVIMGLYTEDMFDVEYDFDKMERVSEPMVNIGLTSVTNKNCEAVRKIMNLREMTQRQSTWEFIQTKRLGITLGLSISAKIPIFSGVSLGFGLEQIFNFDKMEGSTRGRSVTQSVTHSLSVEVNVAPNHWCQVRMVGRRYRATIPYSATMIRIYENGEMEEFKVKGVYRGTQVGEINAVAERCQPIENALPCK